MSGNSEPGAMVCGPGPKVENLMRSGPPELAAAFASWMASLRLQDITNGCGFESHTPSGVASPVSRVVLPVNVETAWAGLATTSRLTATMAATKKPKNTTFLARNQT